MQAAAENKNHRSATPDTQAKGGLSDSEKRKIAKRWDIEVAAAIKTGKRYFKAKDVVRHV